MATMCVDDDLILATAFVPGETAIAACFSQGLVCVRDISTGRDIRSWQCGQVTSWISRAAFSADGTLVATSSRWDAVRVWNMNTGEQIFALQGPRGTISVIAFSSSGRLAAMSSGPLTIQFWDNHTGLSIGNPLVIENSTNYITFPSLAISSDGIVLAVGLSTNEIEVYDLNTQTRASVSVDSNHTPDLVAFSLDGSHLAVVCNKTIHFWDWRTKKETAASLRGHTGCINFVSYSPNGVCIASASGDHIIRIWDVGIGDTAVTQPLPQPSRMTCLAISSNNSIIVSGSGRESLQLWDMQDGQPKLQIPLGAETTVSSVAISPNGRLIAWASHQPPSELSNSHLPEISVFGLWDVQAGELLEGMLECPVGVVQEMVFLPDMSQLVSASELTMTSAGTTTWKVVHSWNLATRLPSTLGTFRQGNIAPLNSSRALMSLSPDERFIAVAVTQPVRVCIWQTHSGWPVVASLHAGRPDVSFVAFSRDNSKIVTGSYYGFEVRDILSRQVVSIYADDIPMRNSDFLWLARSPNDPFTAREANWSSEVGQKMQLWDAEMPGAVTTVHLNEVGAGAAFSADSQSLVIGGRDRIMTWQIEAVLALAARAQCDPLAQLLRNGPPKDEWVKGPSGELLLWIPIEYHDYLQLPPCTLMISKHCVVLTGAATGLHYGTDWTSCWR